MPDNHGTAIQWTHAEGYSGETWNPVIAIHKETGKRGWHCEHASRGCDHCYAEAQNKAGIRMGTKEPYTRAARDRVDIQLHETTLLKPLHWRAPRAIFVCSMTDLFGEWVSGQWLDRIFAVMALTPQHRYYVLTKQAGRMAEYLQHEDHAERVKAQMVELEFSRFGPVLSSRFDDWKAACRAAIDARMPWPLQNLWLGVTAENQEQAANRIPLLLACPAAIRFVSYEPGIGRLNLEPWLETINWVIVGGESQSGARPFLVQWARAVIRQCKQAGVPVFIKQLGASPHDSMTGQRLKDLGSHGALFDLWPDDLKVRQFPEVPNA